MPPQWRTALSHVMEVWLPCDFNVTVFQRDLRTPIFKLPHVAEARQWNGEVAPEQQALGIAGDDFVVYSVFEWQERKGPADVLAVYLEACRDARDTRARDQDQSRRRRSRGASAGRGARRDALRGTRLDFRRSLVRCPARSAAPPRRRVSLDASRRRMVLSALRRGLVRHAGRGHRVRRSARVSARRTRRT